MLKRRKASKRLKKPLDRGTAKKRAGRPGIRRSEVRGRAYHYRLIFEQGWDVLGEPLLRAQTEEEVIQAFEQVPDFYKQEFVPTLAPLILKVLREPTFPNRVLKNFWFGIANAQIYARSL